MSSNTLQGYDFAKNYGKFSGTRANLIRRMVNGRFEVTSLELDPGLRRLAVQEELLDFRYYKSLFRWYTSVFHIYQGSVPSHNEEMYVRGNVLRSIKIDHCTRNGDKSIFNMLLFIQANTDIRVFPYIVSLVESTMKSNLEFTMRLIINDRPTRQVYEAWLDRDLLYGKATRLLYFYVNGENFEDVLGPWSFDRVCTGDDIMPLLRKKSEALNRVNYGGYLTRNGYDFCTYETFEYTEGMMCTTLQRWDKSTVLYEYIRSDPVRILSIPEPEVVQAQKGVLEQRNTVSVEESSEKITDINVIVSELLSILSRIDTTNLDFWLNRAETLVLAGITHNSQGFWKKLLAGIGTLYSLSVNESVVFKLAPFITKKLFNTTDLKLGGMYLCGLKENLRRSRLYDIISFMLLPFNTDLELSVGQLKAIHIKCAERIDGMDLMEAIVTASEFISSASSQIREHGNLVGISVADQDLEELLKEYAKVNSDFIAWEASPGDTPDFNNKIIEVTALYNKAHKAVAKAKSPMMIKSLYSVVFSLSKILNTYVAKSKVGTLVPAAYAFSLFGPSQVGKSCLAKYIMEHLKIVIGHDVTMPIKVARGDEKFLDHIDNDDKLLLLDDVANVHPDFAESSPLDLFLRIRNNVSTPLDQAELSRKGKICPTFDVIGMTTNISDFNASKYSIMSSSIVQRHNCHITLKMKPEFSTPSGTLDQKKVLERYPSTKRDENGNILAFQEACDIWDITVLKVVVKPGPLPYRDSFTSNYVAQDTPWCMIPVEHNGKTMEDVGLGTLLEFLHVDCEQYRENQKSFVTGMSNISFSNVYCYECKQDTFTCSCREKIEKQTGPLVPVRYARKKYRAIEDKLTMWVSNEVDSAIDDYRHKLDGSVSGVFGVHITKKRFYERVRLLIEFTLRLLEDTKLLHILALAPEKSLEYIDQKTAIRLLETDKISRMGVSYTLSYLSKLIGYTAIALHGGFVGCSVGFIGKIFYDICSRVSLTPVNTKKADDTDTISTKSSASSSCEIDMREVYSSVERLETTLFYAALIATYSTFILTSGYALLTYGSNSSLMDIFGFGFFWPILEEYCRYKGIFITTPRLRWYQRLYNRLLFGKTKIPSVPGLPLPDIKFRRVEVIPNVEWGGLLYIFTFSVIFIVFYLVYDYYYRCSKHIDEYVVTSLEKIKNARRILEPYKQLAIEYGTQKTEAQSGRDEFYIKDWEIFNKSRFEVNMRSKEEVAYAMKHNLVHLSMDGEDSIGLVLRSNRILLPSHFIPFEDKVATVTRYEEEFVGNRKFSITVSKSACTQVGLKDLVVMQFVDGGTFADITNLFPVELHPEPPTGIRYYKESDGKMIVDQCTYHITGEYDNEAYSYVVDRKLPPVLGFAYGAWNCRGLCGSPIFSGSKKTYIKGIHIAGNTYNRMRSYAVPVLKGEIDLALKKENPLIGASLELTPSNCNPWNIKADQPVPVQSPSLYIPKDSSFGFLGRLGGYNTPSNKIHRHSISDALEERGYSCKWGSPLPPKGEKRHGATDKWLSKVTKQQKPVSLQILTRCVEDWKEPLKHIFTNHPRVRVLNRKEVANGAPGEVFLNPLDMSTSVGWPLFKKKRDIVDITDSGLVVFPDYIWEQVKFIEECLEQGKMPRIPATVTGKMEVRKLGKGERKFCNVPICMLLIMRKYFGSVFSVLVENWKLSECAVGINPYNDDWDDFYNHMYQGFGTQWHAEDVGGFDQSIIVVLFQAFGMCLVDLAKDGNYKPRDIQIMKGLISMLCTPCALVDGDLLELSGLMLSGIFGTTHLDSGIISLMKRYTFFSVYGLSQDLRYRDYCRLMCFGDDSIETTKGLWRYNSIVYGRMWQEHGIDVTDSRKNPISKSSDAFAEVSFIKRGFRWCSIRKRWVAPLELDSILKSLHCYHASKHVEPDDVLIMNLQRAAVELTMHPKNVFTTMVRMLQGIDHPTVKAASNLWLSYEQLIRNVEAKVYLAPNDHRLTDGEVLLPFRYSMELVEAQKGVIEREEIVEKQSGKLDYKDSKGTQGHETVELHTQEVQEYSHSRVASRESRADTNLSLSDFLSRPIIIGRLQVVGSSPIVDLSFPIWQTLLNNVRNSNRISNYALFAADIEIEILITANPFYFGKVAIYYQPDFEDDFHTVVTTNRGNVLALNQRHVCVNINEDIGGSMHIPFFYNREFIPLTQVVEVFTTLGSLHIRPITPIRFVGDAPTDPVTVTVMGKFVNVRTRGITAANIAGIAAQSGELEQRGPISKIASSVARYSNMLSDAPYIGPYAKATELVSTGVGAMARLFGFSRPPIIDDAQQIVARPISNMAVTNMRDNVNKMTLDVKQELTVDPMAGGDTQVDPLSIAQLSNMESYLLYLDWSTNLNFGDTIGRVRVDPAFASFESSTGHFLFSPLASACLPFTYYSGTLLYTFEMVCSRFHRGRMVIQYEPDPGPTEPDINFNTNMCYELDLEPNKSVTIAVGPTQPTSYIEMAPFDFTAASGSNSAYFGGAGWVSTTNTTGNGLLVLKVLNKLSAPTGGDPTVSILVSVRAGPDFRLAKPSRNIEYLEPIVAQSGTLEQRGVDMEVMTNEPSGKRDPNIDLDYMGETIYSLRQLCKRYTYYRQYIACNVCSSEAASIHFTFPGFLYYKGFMTDTYPEDIAVGPVGYNYNYLTNYQYCALMFHGVRGAIRYKVFPACNSSVPQTWASVWRAADMPNSLDYRVEDYDIPLVGANIAQLTRGNGPGYEGSIVGHSDTNTVIDVENPFQNSALFDVSQSATELRRFNRITFSGRGKFTPNEGERTLSMYAAAGEDFQVYWFRGLPPMRYRDGFPTPA